MFTNPRKDTTARRAFCSPALASRALFAIASFGAAATLLADDLRPCPHCCCCRSINTQSYAPVSWSTRNKEHVVLQRHDYSCGAGALATILTYYWNDPTGEGDILYDVERYLTRTELEDRVKNGLSITDLKNIAILRGYRAVIGDLDGVQALAQVKVPVIVAIKVKDVNHYVVVRGVIGAEVYLADPTRGNIRIPIEEFAQNWIRNVILVVLHKDQDLSPASRLTIPFREIDPHYSNRNYVRRMITQPLP